MSSLDSVFIRAYSRDSEPAPASSRQSRDGTAELEKQIVEPASKPPALVPEAQEQRRDESQLAAEKRNVMENSLDIGSMADSSWSTAGWQFSAELVLPGADGNSIPATEIVWPNFVPLQKAADGVGSIPIAPVIPAGPATPLHDVQRPAVSQAPPALETSVPPAANAAISIQSSTEPIMTPVMETSVEPIAESVRQMAAATARTVSSDRKFVSLKEQANKDYRDLRLDSPASEIPSPHVRSTMTDPAGADSRRRQVTLDPPTSQSKFAAVWEVDQFAWTDVAESLTQQAEEAIQDAGVHLRAACREGLRVLTITSSGRGEGRTTVSICLARAVAASGIRVAILDADIDNPDLAAQLGLDVTCGWDEVVLGRLPLDEVAVHSIRDRITVIPLLRSEGKREFELNDRSVTEMIRSAAEQFDLLLIDMGPLGNADRRMFESGEYCPSDAAIIVHDLGSKAAEPAPTIGARLRAAGFKSVGIVENFVPRELALSQQST